MESNMSPRDKSSKKKSEKSNFKDLPPPPSLLNEVQTPISSPTEMPPLPKYPKKILTRAPFPESPIMPQLSKEDSVDIEDNITSDILRELRQGDFGSFLLSIPEHKPKLTVDEIESPRFLAAKDAYLEAGKKHLELNFHANAAMNYSCAILCMFLGKDVFAAVHLMANMGTKLPFSISNRHVFQGVKVLLKGILLKNSSYITQARKWLLDDTDHLYKEDEEIIKRAIRQSEEMIKLD
jgi:hypothetical protein